MSGWRARLGAFGELLFPGLEEYVFTRDRNRAVPASKAPRSGYRPPAFREREPHIVVAPQEGPGWESWQPGTRNFYFEAWQSARELYGEAHVSVLPVDPGMTSEAWHRNLRDHLHDTEATHIVTHIEHDPGDQSAWTWDIAWNQLTPQWDGVLLGVMFDSAFPLTTMKTRRIARMSANFVAVDICSPANSVFVSGRSEVGPVTMPMSAVSLDLIRQRLAGIEISHDVSFIGVLYPYRIALLDHLGSLGIDVSVNPHRSDVTVDPESSRQGQPSWLDYMAGLASSRMTINFSRFSAGDAEQLKTRVIEATLAGTFLLTDDVRSSRLYFEPDVEYGYFESVEQLPSVISTWLADPARLDGARRAAQHKAFSIAHRDFWTRIERGLVARGLPQLGEPAES